MEIGRYYLKRKHFAAAANRFRIVVEDFQTTTQPRRYTVWSKAICRWV